MVKKTVQKFTSVNKINMRVINASIKIRELIIGYIDNSMSDEGGITTMNGKMCLRPHYQRAYIADTKAGWRENLINSILCGFPINRIYIGVDSEIADRSEFSEWALEMLDGQQRSKTICDFAIGLFPVIIDGYIYHFDNLSPKQREDFLNYSLDVTYCIGDEDARIAWFKRINQENAILVPQELRNATYVGEWLECAKKFFSATTYKAKKQINDKDDKYCASNYSTGRSIERSEFLELAIDWIAYDKYPELRDKKHEDERINRYMADHQHDTDANEIISYYKTLIDWIWDVFFHDGEPKSWQSVRSQDWGRLYAEYKDIPLTEEQKMHISKRTKEIVGYGASVYQKTDGIYEWVLRGEKKDEENTYLHLRGFSPEDKSAMYNAQGGYDPIDGKHYDVTEMHAHHIKSWRSGGDSKYDNLVWLSEETHRKLHAGDLGIGGEELKNMRDELIKRNKSK